MSLFAGWLPGSRPRKPSIRGASGEFLTPSQQLQALLTRAEEKFCQGVDFIPQGTLCKGVPVTSTQIQHALRKLPIRKAAPPTAAPSALWKNSAKELADLFHGPIASMWESGPHRECATNLEGCEYGLDAQTQQGLQSFGQSPTNRPGSPHG